MDWIAKASFAAVMLSGERLRFTFDRPSGGSDSRSLRNVHARFTTERQSYVLTTSRKTDEVTRELARVAREMLGAIERENLGNLPLELLVSLRVEITPAIPDPYPERLVLVAGSLTIDGETQHTVMRRRVSVDRVERE